jgi:hypothetical protein
MNALDLGAQKLSENNENQSAKRSSHIPPLELICFRTLSFATGTCTKTQAILRAPQSCDD